MNKTQKAELDAAIREWFTEHGPEVEQLIAESRARNQTEAWIAENLARIEREEELYGPRPVPEPPPPRVIATRRVGWERDVIEQGAILPANHPAIETAPGAFVAVQD